MALKNVYIDARCLVRSSQSGISHYVAGLLKAIDEQYNGLNAPDTRIHLLVPFRLLWRVNQYQFQNFKIHRVFLPLRGMNFLARRGWLLPLDIFYGRGIYVFPEFTRLPVLFSRSISVIYDAAYRLYPESLLPKLQAMLAAKIPATIKQSTALITISNAAARDIARANHITASGLKVIYPSVDKAIFYRRSPKEIAQVKARYDIFGRYVLAVGNLEPRKNLTTIIDAFVNLPPKLSEQYTLVLVGADTWHSQPIHDLIFAAKSIGARIVTRMGTVQDQDMPALYSGAELFVCASLYEGFGMPPLEAMACGAPVLSTIVSGLAEAVGNGAARLVDPQDVRECTKKMANILEDTELQESLRIKGFEHVDTFTSWTDSARRLQQLITSL